MGTGVACVTKDYGTGADASLGRIEVDPQGRVTIYSDVAEMGNGIGTALANRVAADRDPRRSVRQQRRERREIRPERHVAAPDDRNLDRIRL